MKDGFDLKALEVRAGRHRLSEINKVINNGASCRAGTLLLTLRMTRDVRRCSLLWRGATRGSGWDLRGFSGSNVCLS